LGKYDEAVQAYDKAIELDPKYAKAWVNKGLVLRMNGKYEKALQMFNMATKLDPQYASGWNNKGYALKQLGKTSESNAAYAKAKELGYIGPTWLSFFAS
jgi:tetratricopeptide (TPR) repeat protein